MASINDLLDEILEMIFIYTTPWLDESITLSQVCRRWKNVMDRRFRLVKYIITLQKSQNPFPPSHGSGMFLLHDEPEHAKRRIKRRACSQFPFKLLPNLMVVHVGLLSAPQAKDFFAEIDCKPRIKGLDLHIPPYMGYDYFSPLLSSFGDKRIEMLSLRASNLRKSLHHYARESITQLRLEWMMMGDIAKLRGCPKLKRLNITLDREHFVSESSIQGYSLMKLGKQNLENLEMFEIGLPYLAMDEDIVLKDLCQSLSFCTKLKSIYLYSQSSEPTFRLNGSYCHEGVENLVLESNSLRISAWISFKHILTMFPNLKNLALRCIPIENEETLHGTLRLLKKLEYLEIMQPGIAFLSSTSESDTESESDADIESDFLCLHELSPESLISTFFELHGRTTRCRVGTQLSKDPNIYDRIIGEGFDFMTHVFPRRFNSLPHFLIENN